MKASELFTCVLVAALSCSLLYNTEIFKPTTANASTELKAPVFHFDPVKKFDMNIDLVTGIATITGNADCQVNVQTSKPAPVINPIKKEIEYVTKTEVIEKVVMFPLLAPRFHKPIPLVPITVEK